MANARLAPQSSRDSLTSWPATATRSRVAAKSSTTTAACPRTGHGRRLGVDQMDLGCRRVDPGDAAAERLGRLDPLEPEQAEELDRLAGVGGVDLDRDVLQHPDSFASAGRTAWASGPKTLRRRLRVISAQERCCSSREASSGAGPTRQTPVGGPHGGRLRGRPFKCGRERNRSRAWCRTSARCRSNDGCRSGTRGIALELLSEGVQRTAHTLSAPRRGLVAVEERTHCSVKIPWVPLAPAGANSTVASETEILVLSKRMS